MILAGVAGFSLAWALGGLLVAVLWSRDRPGRDDAALLLPLGLIVGLGVTSVTFGAASLVTGRPALAAGLVDLALLVGLAWFWRKKPARIGEKLPRVARPAWSWLDWGLATLLAQAVAVGLVVVGRSFRTEPFGGWDGWAIWNLQARLMVRAGPEWAALLAAPELSWTHPDYPKLVPASVARLWSWMGTEAAAGAGLVSVAFAAGLVALLGAGLARWRDTRTALLGMLLLVGTPFFLQFAPNQHADIPLAAFLLAAVTVALLGGRLALAGLCAGLAAWTKNEGLLFVLVFAGAVPFALGRDGVRREGAALAAGLLAGLLPVIAFKWALAPPTDLLAHGAGGRLAQLWDVERHRTILAALPEKIAGFGEWRYAPLIAMALPFLAWRARRRLAPREVIAPAVVALMLGGYLGVYLISPHDLRWHLDTSLVRLLLQLWPLVLLGWGLALPPVGSAGPAGAGTGRIRSVFVVTNLLAGAAVALVLAGQPAANELAVARIAGGRIAAVTGEGWHGVERSGRTAWAWSGGTARLQVYAPAGPPAGAVELRFSLRSLAPRRVTLRGPAGVLWQGEVGDQFLAVRVPAVALPTAVTTFEFSTDAPGTPETSAPGARPLAFAVYDLSLREAP